MMNRKINVILTGFGTVGREFVRLLEEKGPTIQQTYGVELQLVGVAGRNGFLYDPDGLDLETLLACGKGSAALDQYAKHHQLSLQETVFCGDVLVESTPTDIVDGGPALSYIMRAIDNQMDVVALSKGALVTAYRDIMNAAKAIKVRVRYSGATAAALPTLDVGMYSLAGCRIERIEGILNGTTNYILTKMHEDRLTFEQALSLAQEKGIAETNPALDISGTDSACKILLLANSLLDTDCTLRDVRIVGVEGITPKDIERSRARGKRIKLIAKAYRESDGVSIEVSPVELEQDSPLAGIAGTNKGVWFHTDLMGTVCIVGGASHPRAAAAAALKDVINLFRRD
jgi:homoserine dehydrogenase